MGKKKIQPKLNIPPVLSINNEGEMKETKPMEESMAKRLKILSCVYDSMSEGIALRNIINDSSGKAVNHNKTVVNPTYGKITGLTRESIIGKKVTLIYSLEEAPYLDIYSQVASTVDSVSFETFFPLMKIDLNYC